MSAGPVLLYGATGYTGRLIAQALADLGAEFVLAGRDGDKLHRLATTFDDPPSTVAVDLDDARGLRAAVAEAGAVVSAAGPFARLAPPLVRACLQEGVPFGDITGEQSFMRWCLDRDAVFRDASIPVVNGLGFDVVPSDLAAVLASDGLEDVARLDLCIHTRGGGVSRGTRRTMAESMGEGVWFDDGTFRPAPAGRWRRAFDVPGEGPREAAFIPWGDVVTAPRSTGARHVRTWFTMPPHRVRNLHFAWPLLVVAGKLPPVKRKAAARAAESREGPTPDMRAATTFAIIGEATAGDGRTRRAAVTGRDPYGLTGRAAALAGMHLARRETAPGALTPSQAFDLEDLAAKLKAFDVAWERLG